MKIIGFSQLHNELEKGNLHNWIRSICSVCDLVYIFDQGSSIANIEEYKRHPQLKVIRSDNNLFFKEIHCKAFLLKTLLEKIPDVDWVFWMDGDTILDGRLTRPILESNLAGVGEDSASLGHINLWRSDLHYRIDNMYHSLNEQGVVCLWNAKKNKLEFTPKDGHHQPQHPPQIKTTKRLPFVLLHKGFTTTEQIINRYNLYKSCGQNGWKLDRLLAETGLEVNEADPIWYPDWFTPFQTQHPSTLTPILTLYNEQKH